MSPLIGKVRIKECRLTPVSVQGQYHLRAAELEHHRGRAVLISQWSHGRRDLCGCSTFSNTNNKRGRVLSEYSRMRLWIFKTPMKLWYREHLLYYSPLSALSLCPPPLPLNPSIGCSLASAPSTVYLTPALILPPFCSSLTKNPNGFALRSRWENSSREHVRVMKKHILEGKLCVFGCA